LFYMSYLLEGMQPGINGVDMGFWPSSSSYPIRELAGERARGEQAFSPCAASQANGLRRRILNRDLIALIISLIIWVCSREPAPREGDNVMARRPARILATLHTSRSKPPN
jgi:hypothetical protein